MKELLEKFFGLFSEGVEKMKDDNTEEAIKKFTEASELTSELTKKAEDTDNNIVDVKKFFESDEGKETLEKYADLFVSASTLKEVIEDLKETTEKINQLQKEKESDDETVSKTLDDVLDRVEKLESGTVSKIED